MPAPAAGLGSACSTPRPATLADLDLPFTAFVLRRWPRTATRAWPSRPDADEPTAGGAASTPTDRRAGRELRPGADAAAGPGLPAASRGARSLPRAGGRGRPRARLPAAPTRDVGAPEGELPPYVVFVHGGPTAQASAVLDLEIAYFTSRGIGVVDVNYGGSTGYGRAYRERLREQWGVVDVEDCAAAAARRWPTRARPTARGWRSAAAAPAAGRRAGGADPRRERLRVRHVLLRRRRPASRWPSETHDFESRYLDGLVGPLPEAPSVYVERVAAVARRRG